VVADTIGAAVAGLGTEVADSDWEHPSIRIAASIRNNDKDLLSMTRILAA
jgi:hypothetical protein